MDPHLLKHLRRDTYSLKNRLQSIIYDSQFISQTSQHPDLTNYPIIPNERCGPWYTPTYEASTYFKSTDGHTNEWQFSLRRLNMHIIPLLGRFGGIISVDSTRKGKLLPDALSKTIPIWCAVVNSILFEGYSDQDIVSQLNIANSADADFILRLKKDNWVRTPREMVSANEHNQIVQRVPGFAAEVSRLGLFSREQLIESLGTVKPLIPTWWYPGCKKLANDSFYFGEETSSYYNVACVSASDRITSVSNSDTTFDYIQGAGDDHELWTKECKDLTPTLFWKLVSKGDILGPSGYIRHDISESDLLAEINGFVQAKEQTYSATKVGKTGIAFGKISANIDPKSVEEYTNVVVLSTRYKVDDSGKDSVIDSKTDSQTDSKESAETHSKTDSGTHPTGKTILHFMVEPNKKGSKELRNVLPKVIGAIDIDKPTLVLCETGDDISCGCVLALLCRFYDLSWNRGEIKPSKDGVKKHLSLLGKCGWVNPSRNTLQSVNVAIMSTLSTSSEAKCTTRQH